MTLMYVHSMEEDAEDYTELGLSETGAAGDTSLK